MDAAYTGGCACGAVRYSIDDDPVFSNDCQCLDCQHKSGTGHGSYVSFADKAKVRLDGVATEFDMRDDNGKLKTSGFCAVCGSPVYMTFEGAPQVFTIHAGSLDDPSRYQPQAITYASRALAWDRIDERLPQFAKMPPS